MSTKTQNYETGLQAETVPPLEIVAQQMGPLAVGGQENASMQEEGAEEPLLFGAECLANGNYFINAGGGIETNIPPRFFELVGDPDEKLLHLPATVLDTLPLQDYEFIDFQKGSRNLAAIKTKISITEIEGLRYFSVSSAWGEETEYPDLSRAIENHKDSNEVYRLTPSTNAYGLSRQQAVDRGSAHRAMEVGGHKRVEDRTVSPTPNTAVEVLKSLGIKAKLSLGVSADGYTPLDEYIQAFAEGAYSLGSGATINAFFHDIEGAHYPGLVAGGQPALDMLVPLAKLATGRDFKYRVMVGRILDNATEVLRMNVPNIAGDYSALWHRVRSLEEFYDEASKECGLPYKFGDFSKAVLGNAIKISGLWDSYDNLDFVKEYVSSENPRAFVSDERREIELAKRQAQLEAAIAREQEAPKDSKKGSRAGKLLSRLRKK